MSANIPDKSRKSLLRLNSARIDVMFASDAYIRLMRSSDDVEAHHFFTSMVTAYGRPFTANQGLGSLLVEYPAYPDFPDAEMNDRHKRLIDLRNKFHAHSSLEGTKTWLLTPGSVNPRSNEAVTDYGVVTAKLHFNDKRFATWLHDAVNALLARLETDIVAKWKIVGSAQLQHGQFLLLESDKPFQWTP